MIVQELHKLQHRKGFLTKPDLRALADRLHVPLHRIEAVVSFFPHFRTSPPSPVQIAVCRDMSCHLSGSRGLVDQLSKWAKTKGQNVSICQVSCLGRCDRAPAVLVNDLLAVNRSAKQIEEMAEAILLEQSPGCDFDRVEPLGMPASEWKIDIYAQQPTYQAVREYVKNSDPEKTIRQLQAAGLLGMGGAGGRAYKKWQDVRDAVGDRKYVVCNGDESEPGTFKDREILLQTPHLVLEGMILGGLTVGASQGYVYIRHEYHEQIEAVQRAITEARRQRVCGNNILDSGYSFELEVFVSPGGYICGEQSALIEAMEDKRAEPRNRPPQLQTNGLWDKPTLLNNVETFAWVPSICTKTGEWYSDQGVESAKGLRFFSISGDVKKPGVYEVPCGITLGQLIDQYAGGICGGDLKAVALSGPSGGFLPDKIPIEHLSSRFTDTLPEGTKFFPAKDIPLDVPTSRAMGIMLGPGIVIYNQHRDMVEQAQVCLRFYRDESCGKCVPCRIGSEKLVHIATQIGEGKLAREEMESQQAVVNELAETMEITAICGLGMVASNPLKTLFKFFPQEVEPYIR